MSTQPNQLKGPFAGLSVKLMALIAVVILVVEIAVYLPLLANYRAAWLDDRLRVGGVAVQVFDAVPDVMDLPAEVTDPLLQSAGALAIVYRRAGQSDLIALDAVAMPTGARTADMRDRNPLVLIRDAVDTLVFGRTRVLRIVGNPPGAGDVTVEVLMPENPLRADMLAYSRNLLILALIIAGITAFVIFLFAQKLMIAPLQRLSGSVVAFRQAPENGTLILVPDGRRDDELGVLERELAAMQAEIFAMLRQRRHLADLGLAVAKINHDLRNMLSSAQLLSDQVATLDDPKVQRLAPRLVHTLDRAIGFAQTVLDYGRDSAAPPVPRPVAVRALAQEAALAAGVAGHPDIVFRNEVPKDFSLAVDPDHLARVLLNLVKNAREALEPVAETKEESHIRLWVEEEPGHVRLLVADNGPGLPPRARENLFVAFEGSGRAGGTGLGLAISRELVEANGGRLFLVESGAGAVFAIEFPTGTRAD